MPVNVAAGHSRKVHARLAGQVNSCLSRQNVNYGEYHILPSLLFFDNVRQSASHTPVVEEVAGPRDICQAVLTDIFSRGVLQQLFKSSSITPGYYALNKDVDPKRARLGSETNAMKEAQRAHTRNDTARIVLQQHLQ